MKFISNKQNSVVGLNFADEKEAEGFGKAILDRLAVKQRKKEGKVMMILIIFSLLIVKEVYKNINRIKYSN